jgi:hypothetical protein
VSDYKILVQQIDDDGQAVTVWASEIRDAATEEQAFERFIAAYRNRPDRGEPPADGTPTYKLPEPITGPAVLEAEYDMRTGRITGVRKIGDEEGPVP